MLPSGLGWASPFFVIGHRDLGEGLRHINDLVGVRRPSRVVHVCLIGPSILLTLHCPGEALMVKPGHHLLGGIPVFGGLTLVPAAEPRGVGGLPLLGGGSHL